MGKVEQAEVPSRLDKAQQSTNRLSLPLTDEGAIDWEHVQQRTKEKFASVVSSDPDALEMIGLASGGGDDVEVSVISEGITDENIKAFIDAVSKAVALGSGFVISKIKTHPFLVDKDSQKPIPLKIRPDILLKCSTLTDEQHKELDPRVKKIVDKHTKELPEAIKKHLDLWMLAGMFLKYNMENVASALEMQIKGEIKALQDKQNSVKPTPIDTDRKQPGA